MKVLVWKSYGYCKVYRAEPQDFEAIKSEVQSCLEYYAYGDRTKLSNCSTWGQLVGWVADHTEDDDNFEYFDLAELIG